MCFCMNKKNKNKRTGLFSSESAILAQEINLKLLHFAGYSIIWQNTSRYRITIDSYLLGIEKKSVIFSGSKQIPQKNTIVLSQENMSIFTGIPNLSGCFEFALQF